MFVYQYKYKTKQYNTKQKRSFVIHNAAILKSIVIMANILYTCTIVTMATRLSWLMYYMITRTYTRLPWAKVQLLKL